MRGHVPAAVLDTTTPPEDRTRFPVAIVPAEGVFTVRPPVAMVTPTVFTVTVPAFTTVPVHALI